MAGPGPAYRLVAEPSGVDGLVAALRGAVAVSLGLRTTGPDPRVDRLRLVSLAFSGGDGLAVVLLDCDAVDPTPLWAGLAGRELVLHDAAPSLAFLAQKGFIPVGVVHDTLLLAQLMVAGTGDDVSLVASCGRWLGRSPGKAGRGADWSGRLAPAQLAHAAAEVELLKELRERLNTAVAAAGLEEAARIELRCLPALAWLARQGVAVDRAAWLDLSQEEEAETASLQAELDRSAPPKPNHADASWNWNDHSQAKQALMLAGCDVADVSVETLAAVDHPLAALLVAFRSSYSRSRDWGRSWVAKNVQEDGRVYGRWAQIGAASGRMSCLAPNLQNLPRGGRRRCVVAPPGRVLVAADYSQIELRIAAKLTGDDALREAFEQCADLHARTAELVLRVQPVTEERRRLAKALNFGLLFGMGEGGFRRYAKSRYGLDLTPLEVRGYRDDFFRNYPKLLEWHRKVARSKDEPVDTRTLAGRRRIGVSRFTEKLNTPVQGTGADGLKLALALLWERRAEVPGAFPVLAIHDEIVVEAAADQAEAAAAWLRAAMIDGMQPMLTPIPVVVKVRTVPTWA